MLGRRAAVLACAGTLLLPGPAAAHPVEAGPPRLAQASPLNDLFALGRGEGQAIERVPTARRAEPPLDATPNVGCGPGSRPEPGVQGRVPAGAAAEGLRCNVTLLGRHGQSGGFKVLRYTDAAGHECGFYDTALLFPLNVFGASADALGVVVLDMSDPSRPRQTATLTEPAMLSPHESLVLNERRGLLAAVTANPTTYPGVVSVYDVSRDCRRPVLQSTAAVARLGHESGFAPDGRTFYATSTAFDQVTAIDLSDPRRPTPVWVGRLGTHGMSFNAAGTRMYATDTGGELVVLDTSQVQERRPDPQVRELSRLTWERASIPQHALPFTRDGRPYLLEVDEYTAGTAGDGDRDAVGAARIIDIADETRPRSIANLRLAVNNPAEHRAAADDPGASSPVQGYAAHYCGLPPGPDPQVVACSFITSGLRVFDISDLERPEEIAYFVAPTKGRAENGFQPSSFAMSQPVVVPGRREVWYSDGTAGLHVLRIDEARWPAAAAKVARVCGSRRAFTIRLPRSIARGARVRVGARSVPVRRRGGRLVARVDLRGRARGLVAVRVTGRTKAGRRVVQVRRYRPCTRRG